MSNIPDDRRYTKSHEWILIEGEIVTIGITDHAQEELGDLVFVQLPDINSELSKGSEMVTLESVKAAADVYSPVDGTVIETNGNLDADPEQINNNPYDSWLVKISLSDGNDFKQLLDAKQYQKFIDSE